MPTNLQFAAVAKMATKDHRFTGTPMYCSRWVRQVYEFLTRDYSKKFFGATAIHTLRLMRKRQATHAFHGTEFLQIGDIVFKWGRPFGHVGIVVAPNLIAENAVTLIGRTQGAKGFRTFKQFGRIDEVARLFPTVDY